MRNHSNRIYTYEKLIEHAPVRNYSNRVEQGVGHDVIMCMTLCNLIEFQWKLRDEKLNVSGTCKVADAEIDWIYY